MNITFGKQFNPFLGSEETLLAQFFVSNLILLGQSCAGYTYLGATAREIPCPATLIEYRNRMMPKIS